MLRNIFATTTLCFGLLIALPGCDVEDESTIEAELELEDELESIAPADLQPEEFVDEEPISSEFACESIDGSPDDLAAPTGPLEAPGDGSGGGGCGSTYIIYGTWQNTTQCGGCYIAGIPGRKQVKFDQFVNQCGLQSTIMHDRCVTC